VRTYITRSRHRMKPIRIAEIAKLANVTIGTVDRALDGRKGISAETRSRILEIARSVGYRPNIAPMCKEHYLAPQMVMRSTFHLFREMGAEPGDSVRAPITLTNT
jgi:hypothetical protein